MLPLPRKHKNNSLIVFGDSSGCRVALLTLSFTRLRGLGIRRDDKGTMCDNEMKPSTHNPVKAAMMGIMIIQSIIWIYRGGERNKIFSKANFDCSQRCGSSVCFVSSAKRWDCCHGEILMDSTNKRCSRRD